MVKATIFGVIWCVVLYFVSCFVVGAVAGAIAGMADPENASAAGAQAGAVAVSAYRPIILLGAVTLAFIGSWSGVLPGTKRTKAEPADGA
jgi:hypothetical protein